MSVSSTISTSASNLTKFYAGGSGDNIIADGYIKTVEKVWLDSYPIAFTNTLTTIQIAEIPENKKITRIVVDILTTVSQTSGTVSIGYIEDTTDILATTGVSDFMTPHTITHNLTRTSISIPGYLTYAGPTTTSATTAVSTFGGFQSVTGGTQTTIGIKLNNWTMTTGTVKTAVYWT